MTVDILLPAARLALFVDGCFWHGHDCRDRARLRPAGPNADLWKHKLEEVKSRERRAEQLLKEQGFVVQRFWECDVIRDPDRLAAAIAKEALSRRLRLTRGN